VCNFKTQCKFSVLIQCLWLFACVCNQYLSVYCASAVSAVLCRCTCYTTHVCLCTENLFDCVCLAEAYVHTILENHIPLWCAWQVLLRPMLLLSLHILNSDALTLISVFLSFELDGCRM
jgi:hypothetical protein